MPVVTADPLVLSEADRAELEVMASATVLPLGQVRQARGLLLAAEGMANAQVGRECGVSRQTVIAWRKKFAVSGLAGVGQIAPGRGRKSSIPDEVVAEIVSDTTSSTPDDADFWSTRSMAAEHGVGKDTVQRIWKRLDLKPWQVDTFKVSNDPDLEAKLSDVVGLYLDPPARAAVFCFDEKSQVQALQRSQPSLPMKPGRAGTRTHDYKRHGTTTLFAAMNMASGHVINHCCKRHRAKEFLAFLKIVDAQVPRDLQIHMILDNYATHKHADVVKWLSKPRQKRWHLHFIPTSSSWSNLIERWFKELTDKKLTRSSFNSVDHLIDTIDEWADNWNTNPKPYVWTKPAAEILAKIRRARQALTRKAKSATDH